MKKEKLWYQLLEAPEDALSHLNLIYVDKTKIPILRLPKGNDLT